MSDPLPPDHGSAIEQLAITYHKTVEGEYGCPGLTCPGVQRLTEFGKLCAQVEITRLRLALEEAQLERDDWKAAAEMDDQGAYDRLAVDFGRLANECDAAKTYAQHLPTCGKGRQNARPLDIGEWDAGACTCGLAAILADETPAPASPELPAPEQEKLALEQEKLALAQLRQGVQAIEQEMHKSAFSTHWADRLRALLSHEAQKE